MDREIAFIGTGRAAWSLANAFVDVGNFITFACSRTEEPLNEFGTQFMVDEISTDIKDIVRFVPQFRICVIAVPDSAIKEVADTLAALPLKFEDCLFMHLSGSKTSEELSSLLEMGAMTGSFHIPQSFPTKKAVVLWNLPVCIEASTVKAEKLMLQIANKLELNPICIKPELKIYYHLAAVFASNFFPAIIEDSIKLFEKAGGKRADYFEIFKHIINTTISNIIGNGPKNSVSGVVSRKDTETINQHIAALSDDPKMSEILSTYLHLTEKTAKLLGVNLKITITKNEQGGK